MQYLNIGCGKRFHQQWINIDKVPGHPSVKQCDVEHGLPFSDCSFDVVYHSHVLEHFEVQDAKQFLRECYRVLKPDGVIRVAVPDLEQIVLCYLQTLQQIDGGIISARDDYDWIMLELYDQVVRNTSGGQMAAFLKRQSIPNQDFVVERCGVEFENVRQQFEHRKFSSSQKNVRNVPLFLSYSLAFRRRFVAFYEQLLKIFLGKEYRALEIGRFRCSGENHQWMYDRFSLHRILEGCDFVNVVQRNALQSYFLDWSKFNLDTDSDGTVYKPDSLYMEAVRP